MITEQENLVNEYLNSLTDKEKKGYEIAKSHLGSAFQLEKSSGYIEFLKRKQEN